MELTHSWRTLETLGVLGLWAIVGLLVAPVVLRRMARRVEPPTREEGFSRIVIVRSGPKKSRSEAKAE